MIKAMKTVIVQRFTFRKSGHVTGQHFVLHFSNGSTANTNEVPYAFNSI